MSLRVPLLNPPLVLSKNRRWSSSFHGQASPLLVVRILHRRFEAEHPAPAPFMAIPEFADDDFLKIKAGNVALQLTGLIVQALQGLKLLLTPQPRLADRRFHHLDCLVIDPNRHRKRMAILTA